MRIIYGISDMSSQSKGTSPFTQLISDFRGKNLPSEQIEADYNNTLNYPNNYFVAPERWHECFYTTFKKNMLLLSEGLENIVRIKPPFNRYTMFSLFQIPSNFNTVKKQYLTIAPLTKKLHIIGETGLANGTTLPNTEIIDSSGSGLEKNWLIIVLTQDEGCALVAEEFETGRYRGFFTTNMNLTNRCVAILTDLLRIQKVDF